MSEQGGWQIEYYEDDRSRSPVEAFIAGLEPRMRAMVGRAIDLLSRSGPIQPMPAARPVTGERFWELRVQAGGNVVRIFYFALVGRRIIVLHGFVKKDQKTPRSELEVACRRYVDALRRMQS